MSERTTSPQPPRAIPGRHAALAGVAAGAVGLGLSELLAGLLAGAPSLIVAIGDLVITLQPPGAKQLVVDIFGEADKLALNVAIVIVALAAAALLGIVSARWPVLGRAGYAAFGLFGLLAAVGQPLVDPPLAGLVAFVAIVAAVFTVQRLLRMAARPRTVPAAEMPDWGRRRFVATSLAVAGAAAGGGIVGRLLLERRAEREVAGEIPEPAVAPPPLPEEASLEVPGITPIVVPNDEFYRIDTALLVPRPDVASWRLRVTGMVDRPFELTYDELVSMPLVSQYVTIACVSNEVGGNLVGNALWTGVPLGDLLDRAGVQEGATQIVGLSVDNFSAGFPTAWVTENDRQALVAVEMNGDPLPPAHGYPARLIVPGLYGYVSATKWLTEIRLNRLEEFDGYWVPLGWAKEAPILTQSRIDTPSHGTSLPPGQVPIAGVAWAPDRGISRVEVRVDEGDWLDAELSSPISDATWVQWVHRWQASPGDHVIEVRATDGTGEVQTAIVTPPAPDGARGRHTIRVHVA